MCKAKTLKTKFGKQEQNQNLVTFTSPTKNIIPHPFIRTTIVSFHKRVMQKLQNCSSLLPILLKTPPDKI